MDNTKRILVGKIVAPQGIRGDVRIQTYTEKPEDFRTLAVFGDKIAAGDIKFIRRLNPTSSVIVAHIRGVDDRNAAETIRGCDIFIDRDSLPPAGDGEYYQTDLIGMTVVCDGKQIGVVAGFQNFGAGDIIELDTGEMISFAGANVDLNGRTINF